MLHADMSLEPLIEPHVLQTGGLLRALHAIQGALGWIPPTAPQSLARAFNLSLAEVRGVISFYHDFKTQTPVATTVRVCQAEACQAVGAAKVTARLAQAMGVALGQRRADGAWALEPVYCLGLCSRGPAAQVDQQLLADLDGPRLEALLARFATEGNR